MQKLRKKRHFILNQNRFLFKRKNQILPYILNADIKANFKSKRQ